MSAAQKADPPSPELTAIANTPQAYWLMPESSAATVEKTSVMPPPPGAMPVLVLDGWNPTPRLRQLRCGRVWDRPSDYRGWVDGIAADLGSSRAAVIVEPDALAGPTACSSDQRQERFDLIRYPLSR